ncbi:hypothetical protein I302_106498 [Kwoniella bestiolae CBS 10118]|uniref:MutL C-terminal dimerisation domain-containing protein n=1 Tax=Kwoniella bestiolae CBS 10118 TaxID=1296100 RepID=A0AAJ8MBB6_9TREE
MEPITPLPTPTSTALRSSFIIPTLPQILSELIQNSLDAGSRHLDISICLIKGSESIRVRDDGCGIGEQGLRKVGKRFRTSKTLNESNLGSVGSYGFRGEALSSIASLSLLSITSKTNLTLKAITKIMKSSKTLYLGNDPSRHIPSDSGTIVTVKEIFHNIPVRKEELQRSNEDTLMRQCKKFIEVFALARCGVNWLVWDERGMGDRRKVLDIRGTKSNVHVFRSLYGNALVKRVQNIRVSAGSNRVDGFISLSGDITKSHQHLYINNYPITRSDLHLAISKKFSDSRFGTFASAGEHDDLEDLSAERRKSPRRLERHPIYVLNVTMPSEEVDVSFEPAKGILGYKDFAKVQALLLAVVDEFLKKNGYDRIKSNIKPLSPSSTKGAATNLVSPAAALHGKSPLGKESTSRQDVENGWDLSKPTSLSFSNLNPSATSTRSLDVENTNPDPQLSSQPPHPTGIIPPTPPLTPFDQILALKRPLPTTTNNFPPRISEKPSQSHQWITDLENSIDSGALPFTRRTSPKKRRLEVMQSDETPSEDEGCTYHHHDQPIDPLSARPITLESPAKKRKIDIQLPKSSLKHAHVIGQVDKKFVAVTLPTSKSEDKAVVLVDQHAADERISVENILTSLCMGFRTGDMAITKLTKHTPTILLTTSESEQLARPGAMDVFRRWGIHLTLPFLGIIEGDYVQVQVEAVPSLLVNRLGKKEGVEMTRLIRGYLPVLSEEMGGIKALLDSYSRVKRVEGDWGKEIRFMPREMLELANSKACRGAIMFQDFLNTDQQSRLVSQLGQTKFPFMCAHGRPSMIPLVALQVPPAISTKKVWKREIDWKGWKAKSQSSSR